MKIAYRGNFRPSHSTETHVSAALEELGHEVVRLQEDRTGWSACQRAGLDADLFLWTRTWRLDDDGAYRCLEALRRGGIPTASFHLDLYVGLERESTLVDDPFWRTDTVFSADGGHEATFARHGINHRWLRPAVHGPECTMGTPDKRWACDVAFVGSRNYHREWPYRRELIDWLSATYGSGFRLFGGDGTTVRGADLNDLYATAKVVVGDSANPGFANHSYWSDRAYETVGRGGFLIHPWIEGLDSDFTDGEHLRFYRYGHFGALRALIRHYLDAPAEREAIRATGQAHVRSHHTYRHRMTEMLEAIAASAPTSTTHPRTGDRPRLGIFGARADNRGLGNLTYELARHLHPDKVVVIDMGERSPVRMRPGRFPAATTLRAGAITDADLVAFLSDLDVVYTAETPYDDRLFTLAAEMGVGTVCHAMWEFCRWATDDKLSRPDLFAYPSTWHSDDFPLPRRPLPFPVARDRLPFTLRTSARTFLHVAGPGTTADRNGTRALMAALAHITAEVRVVVRTQHPLPVPTTVAPNVELVVEASDVAEYPDLYGAADVLLMPRRFGGLSLPINEAASLGMPIIATDVEPQRSFLPAESLIPVTGSRPIKVASGRIDCYDPDPVALAAKIDELAGDGALVTKLSMASDAYARSISWETLGERYREVLAEAAGIAKTRPPGARRAKMGIAGSTMLPPGRIDAFASERHFADHLLAIWFALADDERGRFHAPGPVRTYLQTRGVALASLGSFRPPRGPGGVLVASYADFRAAYPRPAIFVEHGAGQRYAGVANPSYSGGRGRDDVVLFICPNEAVAEANRSAYPTIPAAVVGSPRVEELTRIARSAGSPSTVAFSFHWDWRAGPPEGKTAFGHYADAIAALASDERYRLIGHGHPRAWKHLRPFYESVGIEAVEDFADVVARADLYVCDTSSTLYEFAAGDRPVVVLNAPWYRRDVSHGLRFWEFADVGVQVNEPGDLADAIALALSDPSDVAQRRREIVKAVYGRIEGAAARAADAIRSLPRGVPVSRSANPYKAASRRSERPPSGVGVDPPIARLRELGADENAVAVAVAQWDELPPISRVEVQEAFACLSDDDVRQRIAELADG